MLGMKGNNVLIVAIPTMVVLILCSAGGNVVQH
jgi:hypothetical protein